MDSLTKSLRSTDVAAGDTAEERMGRLFGLGLSEEVESVSQPARL